MLTIQQTAKLLSTDNYHFEFLSFSMMLMRLKMLYAGDHSPANVEHFTQEINSFLEKFKANMSADISTLQKL